MSFRCGAGLNRVWIRKRQNVLAYVNEYGRQIEASSHVRRHQEPEHPRRTGRAAGQADRRVQRPLHSHALYGHPMAGPRQAWRCISGQETGIPTVGLGWKSMGVLELTALPSLDAERWVPLVRETDVLLVEGGDAAYLCHWVRQSGLADLLATLPGTVWVGVSAGSMVLTPRVGSD